MPLYPDADLANADWPKRTWDVDLPQDAAAVDLLDIDALRILIALPVFAAAPQPVREAAFERIAALDDDLG